VFLDTDFSYMPDAGEPGMNGWTVQLLQNGAVAMSTTTDANGMYTFKDVVAGNFMVCITPPTGYVQWSPSSGPSCPSGVGYSAMVTATDLNVIFEGLNFGYYQAQ
jgi:hypothetical protein